MKKLLTLFTILSCVIPGISMGAITVKSSGIKKAAPVATKQTNAIESVTSLLPTVINLVGAAKSLSAQQQALSADCAPTSSEIDFVNDLVKEWAMISNSTAESAAYGLGKTCSSNEEKNNSGYYKTFIEQAEESGDNDNNTCYESFTADSDTGKVWYKFPRVSSASICDSIDTKDCHNVSNIYDIFARIPFSDEDYTESEAQKVAQLKSKMEKCAPGKLAAAKRELYGGFVMQTLGSIGQTTGASGTSSVLEAVQSMGGSGNIQSMLPSLGSMATQFFDK